MRVLFDHCVPKPLRKYLAGHEIRTAYQMGWAALKNGYLLEAAKAEFDILLTVDQSISHQQNMSIRGIALVVMVAPDNTLATLQPLVPEWLTILPAAEPGRVYKVEARES